MKRLTGPLDWGLVFLLAGYCAGFLGLQAVSRRLGVEQALLRRPRPVCCSLGCETPGRPAVWIGTVHIDEESFPNTAYCSECTYLMSDELGDGRWLGAY